MAKVFSVQDVQEADADSIVNAFKGKIIKIWDAKTGESKMGEWSFQRMVLQDAAGDEITCTMKDREELPPGKWKNQKVSIVAYHGDKGWSGLYAKDDEYKDETTRVLWMTKTAKIVKAGSAEEDDSDGNGDDDSPPEKTHKPVKHKKPSQSDNDSDDSDDSDSADDPRKAIRSAKQYLMRICNLYGLCLDVGKILGAAHEQRNGMNMDGDQYSRMVTTLFIAANSAGFADELPSTNMFAVKPADDDGDESEGEDESEEPAPKKSKKSAKSDDE
jgi:hypothetical protein